MATIRFQCQSCGRELPADCNQTFIDGPLRWCCSSRCSECGSAIESDDIGFPPDEIRQRILESDGCWEVLMTHKSNLNGKLVAVLRDQLNLTLSEIAERFRNVPGVIFSGTRVEAAWIKKLLIEAGTDADIVQISVGEPPGAQRRNESSAPADRLPGRTDSAASRLGALGAETSSGAGKQRCQEPKTRNSTSAGSSAQKSFTRRPG